MDLRTLRYFVVLGETLHFGRAAQRLHISQPPLSRQIAALEEELGVVLFDRTYRNVQLSAAGRQLYQDAQGILAALEQAKQNVQAAKIGQRGSLAVGFIFSSVYSVMPALTKAYTAAYPEVALHLTESTPTQLLAALQAGEIDIAIGYPPIDPTGLTCRVIYRDTLVAALPNKHPLAQRKRLEMADLKMEPFLIAPKATSPQLYETIFQHCRHHGFTPKIRLETTYQQTLLHLVGQGLGIALVSRAMKSARPAQVKFKALRAAPLLDIVLCWKTGNLNPCITTFATTTAQMPYTNGNR